MEYQSAEVQWKLMVVIELLLQSVSLVGMVLLAGAESILPALAVQIPTMIAVATG
jgi:hypothetical protein